ncbi:MAG: hypothetical protein QNJ13_08190 [Paracoccaceae bacterium]|nr:hypothetical protein [Paracoccaceae bacterium]
MRWSRLARVAAAVLALGGTQAGAEAPWPEVQVGEIGDCPALRGIALYTYSSVARDDTWNRYVLGDTCWSPEAGWHVGAETIQGLTLVEEYPGEAGGAL